jgi:hypothetical protein
MADHVSKPPLLADLTVLCIDGTKASDSATFAYQLELAGRTIAKQADRVAIRNLLTLVGPTPDGTIRAPGPPGDVFPFKTQDFATLPIRKEPLPKSTQRIAYVLLPQGEVTGNKTDFSDSALGGGDKEARTKVARHNSNLLKYLCLAPGVSQVGTDAAYLDFATSDNVSTDILYLSGHGSMSGVVCGEAEAYMPYFELMWVVRPELQSIAKGPYTSPFWIVIGACFSMRPASAEIWLRYLKEQDVPIRGILGYQTTSPLADPSSEINRLFAQGLAQGKTFIEAWGKANGNNEKWTAAAFDHAKDDTLTVLRDLKRGDDTSGLPPPKESRVLRFYEQGRSVPVEITPPVALMLVNHWDISMMLDEDPPNSGKMKWDWRDQGLITNIDFTEDTFKTAIAQGDNASKYVNNATWKNLGEALPNLVSQWEANQRLCPTRIIKVSVFPPFSAPFAGGFQTGDVVEIAMVHVRQTYKKVTPDLKDVFDIVQIYGVSPDKIDYKIPGLDGSSKQKQAAHARNRIRFVRPPGRDPFEPASVALRFKRDAASKHYLWFWFSVRVERDQQVIFDNDFDGFILNPGSPHTCSPPMTPEDPMPPESIWTPPPP